MKKGETESSLGGDAGTTAEKILRQNILALGKTSSEGIVKIQKMWQLEALLGSPWSLLSS